MLSPCRSKVFVGKRADIVSDFWQMPQGGIESGEAPQSAAIRELQEEAGISNPQILKETANWLSYQFPKTLARRLWGGKYLGQRQKWFAMAMPKEGRIDINFHSKPEFTSWRWQDPNALVEVAVPFKREVYAEVLAKFSALLD